MSRSLITGAAGLVLTGALLLSPAAQAHKRWLLPSHTVVSESQWVTVDASVSNDIFDVDRPYPLKALEAVGPDGKAATVDNRLEGHRRSVFDIKLTQPGSYRLTLPGQSHFLSWQQDGETQRRRGWSGAEALLAELPDNAEQVALTETHSRLEAFITVGAPNTKALEPSGQGLELQPITHPNDLYTGENARFRFLVDGEPTEGVEVEVVPAGTRYRDSQDHWTLTSDANGEITVNWPGAGRYYLEAGYADDRAEHPKAQQRRLQYLATFEVLPL